MMNAFGLNPRQVATLKVDVDQSKNPRAAFRLALYFGYSINEPKLEEYWMAKAEELGSKGAVMMMRGRQLSSPFQAHGDGHQGDD